MIVTRIKVPVTEAELLEVQSVSNDRPSLSETLFDKPKISRASYSPETKEVTGEFV